MAFNKFVIMVFVLASVSACSRYTASTQNGDGYGYNQPKSTDPYAYNAKPDDPPPPPPAPEPVTDTVIIVVEQQPVPTPPNDDFAKPEPWMKPPAGTYMALKIKKTPCYGTCPTYTAAIFSDGTAFYHGERFVENIGYFEGRVSMDQLNSLTKMAYQNGFFNLASEYPLDGRYIADLPNTFLHLNTGINNKTITDKGNAPDELNVLQEATHVLLHSIKWSAIKN